MQNFDSPWKQVCDHFFPEMLDLVLNEAFVDIDWTRPIQVLDKELPKIAPEHETGLRYADKLIKVFLKTGAEEIVFVHIEFQNQVVKNLPKRMYIYNYRIFDKFGDDVVSLAILGDSSPTWRPNKYVFRKWRQDLCFEYPVVKLIDYREQEDALTASNNPFAAVILAFLAGEATRANPEKRFSTKIGLMRRLYQKQFSRETIINLFQFIDWTLKLPPGLAQQFRENLEALEGEKNMPYITSIERMAREEGREEGRIEERKASLIKVLENRFGSLSPVFRNQIEQAKLGQLALWWDQAFTVNDPRYLFEH